MRLDNKKIGYGSCSWFLFISKDTKTPCYFPAFHVVLKFLEDSDLLPYSSLLFFSIQDIGRIQRENIRKTVHRHVLLLLGPFGVLAFSCSSLIEPSD